MSVLVDFGEANVGKVFCFVFIYIFIWTPNPPLYKSLCALYCWVHCSYVCATVCVCVARAAHWPRVWKPIVQLKLRVSNVSQMPFARRLAGFLQDCAVKV